MKLSVIIRFTIDELCKQTHKLADKIFVACIAIILLSTVFFSYEYSNYYKKDCNNTLKYGIDNTGMITFQTDLAEDFNTNTEQKINFKNSLNEIVGIHTIGSFLSETYSLSCFEEFAQIQKKYIQKDNLNYKDTCVLNIDKSLLNLCTLNIPEDIFEKQEKDIIPIILGNGFSNYNIGDEFINKTPAHNYIYRVVAILEDDCKWIKDIAFDSQILGTSFTENLDYWIIIVNNNDLISDEIRWIFSIDDNYNMNDIQEKISEQAHKHNIKLTTGTLDAVFNDRDKTISSFIQYLLKLLSLVIVVIITMFSTMQAVTTINNMSNYGIMLANGATGKDISLIIIFQNVIQMFISFILSIPIVLIGLKVIFGKISYDFSIALDIAFRFVFWKVFVIMLIIALVASVAAVIILSTRTPVELLGGKDK